jgi:hypothetical protein
MGYPRLVKRLLTSLRGATALLAWSLLPPSAPADLSAWNWDAARALVGITDHLSAIHLTEDGTLIGLDDDGWVVRIPSLVAAAPSGGWPRSRLDGGGDLEGLCATQNSDLLVLLEDRCEILRLDSEGRRVGRHPLSAAIPRGGQGLEGLARVPAADGTSTLWLGHQGARKVYVVQAPRSRESSEPLKLLRTLDLGDEARGMVFDPQSATVLAVMDDSREVWLLDTAGTILDRRPWPKGTQDVEGITFDPFGALLLSLDGGGVWRVPPRQSRDSDALRLSSPATEHGQVSRPPLALTLEAQGLTGRIENTRLHLRVTEEGVERKVEFPLALTRGARVQSAALCANQPSDSSAPPTWTLSLIEEGPAGHALSLHKLMLIGIPKAARLERKGLVLLSHGAREEANEEASARAPLLSWATADQGVLIAASHPGSHGVVLVRLPLESEPQVIGAVELGFECTNLERPSDQPFVLIAKGSKQRRLLSIHLPAPIGSGSEHEGDR